MSVESAELNGAHTTETSWPDFAELEPSRALDAFPPLNAIQARSIVQDRWERLVAVVEIRTRSSGSGRRSPRRRRSAPGWRGAGAH
ncbi:hypothetical protein V2I01_42665 [Micromonospora sp. BRA006-A]|nr:hypothetical protein [Micromonospora sp. BRA006-A]